MSKVRTSKIKNVENQNKSESEDVRVRVWEMPTFINYHFEHFYSSTFVSFWFSVFEFFDTTFLLSVKVDTIKNQIKIDEEPIIIKR